MNRRYGALFVSLCALFTSSCRKSSTGAEETITVWHWMSDREEAFHEVARRYKEKTGIDVKFELYAPSDAYVQKVRAAAQTDTLPEIYGILGEARDLAAFIKAGHVENLNATMFENNGLWMTRFFSKALVNTRFSKDNSFGVAEGVYGVPLDVTNIQMLYNKDLFAKAGLDAAKPPQTWADFIKAGQALKKAGIPGFVSGWGELWLIDCFASNLAYNLMGEEKILKTIKGEVPYTDPDWIKIFSYFEEMRDSGLPAPGLVTMVNKTAEQNFANGRAAMSFNGSWCVNVYAGMNPNLNYGAFLPPAVSEKFPRAIWGGAGSAFYVNAKSTQKQKAVDFLKWMTEKDQQVYLSKETRNLPSTPDALGEIPPVLAGFARSMEISVHPSRLPISEYPTVTESFDKGIQSILIGEKKPKDVAKQVQALKEREMKKGK